MDKISRDFSWKHMNADKGFPLIALHKLCLPKNRGGLGLKKTEAVNKVFQCKLAWKILTNSSSLWVQLMTEKYLHTIEFFTYARKSRDSPIWKNLLSCKALIKQGII